MLHEEGKDDDRVLAPLAFVYGHRPGQGDFSEVGVIVGHRAFRKLHHDLLFFQIDRGNGADIAIEDLALVVVDLLDYPVTHPQRATPSCQLHFSRSQAG